MRNTFSTANSLGADAEAAEASRSSEDADGAAWRSGSDRGDVAEEGEAGWGEGAEEAGSSDPGSTCVARSTPMTEGIVAASSETSSAPDDCMAGEPTSASGERERSPPAAAFSESVRVSHDGEGGSSGASSSSGSKNSSSEDTSDSSS